MDNEIECKIIDYISIEMLNGLHERYKPIGFFPTRQYHFKKCNHKFLVVLFITGEGVAVDVTTATDKGVCEGCSEVIKDIAKQLITECKCDIDKFKKEKNIN